MNLRNYYPLLRTLKIRSKQGPLIAFEPNWAQQEMLRVIHADLAAGRPSRLIVLKARQVGISTLSEALLFLGSVIDPNSVSVVAAHDRASAEHLFQMSKTYYETWPYRGSYPTQYSSRRELAFAANRSSMWVTTAERPNAVRSRTITRAHLSEVAYWRAPTEMMLAFKSAIPELPGTMTILESTANGMGNWFEQAWLAAEAGESEYVPLFFPWWKEPTYIPCFGQDCTDGTCPKCEDASRIKPEDTDERDLVKVGCDLAHLAWRRWAIPNLVDGKLDLFHQEMPSTPEEAFISTGVPAFPEKWLREIYEPFAPERGRLVKGRGPGEVAFKEDSAGPLRIFKRPASDLDHGRYFIGADPCIGSVSGDFAAAQVINRRTKEQVAVWEGRINPYAFADELAKLGTYYNHAVVSPEIEGGGQSVIGRLTAIYSGYVWQHRWLDRTPDAQMSKTLLGFASTPRRRVAAIAKLSEMVEREYITIHDRRTYEQMRGFSYYGAADYASEQNDDLVMALVIAVFCESVEPVLRPLEISQEPRSDGVIFGESVEFEEFALGQQ